MVARTLASLMLITSLALMADFGIQSQFNVLKFFSSRDKNFSVGVVVKNLGMEFYNNQQYESAVVELKKVLSVKTRCACDLTLKTIT